MFCSKQLFFFYYFSKNIQPCLKPVHGAAGPEQPMHLSDHPHGVVAGHLVKDIGVVNHVEGPGLQPAQVLGICRVKLDIGHIPQLVPLPGEPYVRGGHVNANDLSLGEHFGEGECRESGTCSNIKDPLGLFVSMKSPYPVLDLGLIEEVKLCLPKVGHPDCVTIEVAAGKEVDKGHVEMLGIDDKILIRENVN